MSLFGNGYDGQKMSRNAERAYDNGEKPLSKWSKDDIIYEIRKSYGKEAGEKAKGLTAEELRGFFLTDAGWHHTGKYFNQTAFYAFNDGLSKDRVMALHHEAKPKAPKKKVEDKWAVVEYDTWEGKFRHHMKKVPHKDVAHWTETNGKPSLLTLSHDWAKKRLDSVYVAKELPKKPRKNAKVWKGLY